MAALAQPTRLAIFRLLVVTGSEGLPAGAIAERLGLSHATLSAHLVELDAAQLITRVREKGFSVYGANYATMRGLISYLTRNCCQGETKSSGRAANPETNGYVFHDMLTHGPGDD